MSASVTGLITCYVCGARTDLFCEECLRAVCLVDSVKCGEQLGDVPGEYDCPDRFCLDCGR